MLLIFHLRILPPISKTGVRFFLVSSEAGGLFSLKYLVKGHCFLDTRTSVLFYSFLFHVSLAVSASASRPWCTVSCFLTSLSCFLQSGVHDIRSGNQDRGIIFINSAGGVISINFGIQQIVGVKQNPHFLKSWFPAHFSCYS